MDRKPILVAVFFLLTHVIAATTSTRSFWGVDFLKYASWSWGVFLIGFVILIVAGIRLHWLAHLARRIPWIASPITPLTVLLLVSIAYPSAVHLLGDGYLLIRELDAEAWEHLARMDRAPLTFWTLIRLHRILDWAGRDAEFVYRAVSVLSGLAYAVLSPVVAAAISEDRKRRTIISASLLTAGYVQLFCGYVENYAPLYPGMLLPVSYTHLTLPTIVSVYISWFVVS